MSDYKVHQIYVDDYTCIDLLTCGSDVLVASFPHWGSNDIHGGAFAESFLKKLGFDILRIRVSGNFWFQNLTREVVESATSKIIPRYRLRCGYGSSMGGYGALYFARSLSLHRVLVISTQATLQAKIVPFERRYSLEAPFNTWVHGQIASEDLEGIDCVLAFDPLNDDERHYALIKHVAPHAISIEVPLGGHPVGRVLADMGALKQLVADFFLKLNLQDAFSDRRKILANRRTSPHYAWNLGEYALKKGRPKLAFKLWKMAIKALPDSTKLRRLCDVSSQIGNYKDAVHYGWRAVALQPMDASARLRLSSLLTEMGEFEHGADLIRDGIEINPSVEAFYRHLSFHAEMLGHHDESKSVLYKAIQRGVLDPKLILRLSTLLVRGKDVSGARKVLQDGLEHFPLHPDLVARINSLSSN
ncbi:MAG: hypothetical protein HGA47_04540 [Zoogloea sp.]|nr:hypothetical protein [Zoogloea sp.]